MVGTMLLTYNAGGDEKSHPVCIYYMVETFYFEDFFSSFFKH